MTPTTLPPTIRTAGAGDRRWFYGGGVHTWKATEHDTGGAFLLFEAELDRGKVTPLHTHPDSDETTHVLEGEIRMHVDGRDYELGTGGLAVAPRGVPHAFLVVSETGPLLFLHTPGTCQAFYLDASEPCPAGTTAPGPVDFSLIQRSAQRNGGFELLGTPPFAGG